LPTASPGSSRSSRVYVGPEPKAYTGPESVRPESVRQSGVINAKPKPKGKTISTQASEEDFRLMQRDLENTEKDKKSAQSKPSRTGRPVSAKDDLVSNRGLNPKPKKLSASYQRPGTAITTTSMRKQKKAEVCPTSCACLPHTKKNSTPYRYRYSIPGASSATGSPSPCIYLCNRRIAKTVISA
jgi:hypothetical protein